MHQGFVAVAASTLSTIVFVTVRRVLIVKGTKVSLISLTYQSLSPFWFLLSVIEEVLMLLTAFGDSRGPFMEGGGRW